MFYSESLRRNPLYQRLGLIPVFWWMWVKRWRTFNLDTMFSLAPNLSLKNTSPSGVLPTQRLVDAATTNRPTGVDEFPADVSTRCRSAKCFSDRKAGRRWFHMSSQHFLEKKNLVKIRFEKKKWEKLFFFFLSKSDLKFALFFADSVTK